MASHWCNQDHDEWAEGASPNYSESFLNYGQLLKNNNKIKQARTQFVKYLENREGGVLLEGVYKDYPGTYYYAFGL